MAVSEDHGRTSTGSAVMGVPSWSRVKEVIEAALERPPGERAGFVQQACGDDRALRAEVESLLAAMDQAGSFVERPALHSLASSDALAGSAILDAAGHALKPGDSSVLTRSSSSSAPAVWARSIGLVIPGSIATWRSRSCPKPSHGRRSPRALQARSAGPRLAEPPEHRGDLRSRRVRQRPGARAGARRRTDACGAHHQGACSHP
jgi:hypothetical protein